MCPTGDILKLPNGNEIRLSDNINVAYQVVVSKKFNELDKTVKAFFDEIDKNRSKNPASWITEMANRFDNSTPNAEFPKLYLNYCTTGAKADVISWANSRKVPVSTDSFFTSHISDSSDPCSDLVARKMAAYKNLGMMIASQSITRSFTNDKKAFLDVTKSAYLRVLETWRLYTASLTKAVGKWDKFVTRQAGG